MGQASHAERLPEVIGELYLSAAQDQSGKKATTPRPHGLLQPLSNIAPQISQRRPWPPQHLDAVDPESTPTALPRQTLRRSRQQRVGPRHRTPQQPCGLDMPALQQGCRAIR